MSELPTTEPGTLRAGDSVSWTRSLPDYPPSDGWSLKYRLLSPLPPAIAFAAAAAGALHSVTLDPAVTTTFQAGAATLVSWVERGAERVTLGSQPVQVLPDLTTAGSFDGRSANEIALANARKALDDYLASGRMHVAEYEIGGRRMKFRDVDQIRNLVEHYERQVARDRAAAAAAQGVSPGRVYTRF